MADKRVMGVVSLCLPVVPGLLLVASCGGACLFPPPYPGTPAARSRQLQGYWLGVRGWVRHPLGRASDRSMMLGALEAWQLGSPSPGVQAWGSVWWLVGQGGGNTCSSGLGTTQPNSTLFAGSGSGSTLGSGPGTSRSSPWTDGWEAMGYQAGVRRGRNDCNRPVVGVRGRRNRLSRSRRGTKFGNPQNNRPNKKRCGKNVRQARPKTNPPRIADTPGHSHEPKKGKGKPAARIYAQLCATGVPRQNC